MSKGILEQIKEVIQPQVPLWACELTSKHLIVAGVSKGRNRVEGRWTQELPQGSVLGSLADPNIVNPGAVRAGLNEALRHAGVKGSEITVVVPDEAARIAFLTAENLSKDLEERRAFIRWKLKKTVPFDVDSAQVAFRLLGPHHASDELSSKDAGEDILVALSPRSVIEEYERLFESAELHAGFVLPSTLAALNLFNPPAADSLFVKLAADCVTTSVFQQRRMQFCRRVTDMSLYDAVYQTVLYYQDKLGGNQFQQLFVCEYDSDSGSSVSELEEKLGLRAQRLGPKNIDDILKPALGAVHLAQTEVM